MFYNDPCIFSGYPLNPHDNIRSDDDAIKYLLRSNNSRFIIYYQGDVLMNIAAPFEPIYLHYKDIKDNISEESVFLGKDKQYGYFAIEVKNPIEETSLRKFIDLRSIAKQVSSEKTFNKMPSLLARGKMLLDWHNRHRYCANCGCLSKCIRGGYVRICNKCESEHFPRVDPVVIMMVIKGNRCLLGRGPHFLSGMYSALAGFMEPGETIEEAVRREVMEEVGIKVGKVEYIKSQPWPFPSSLMIGTFCEALDDNINIDHNELEDALWFDKEAIRQVLLEGGTDQFRVPEKIAIARHLLERHLMEHWVNE